MEQIGTKLVGSVAYKQLFKSSLGPNDVIACTIKGGQSGSYPLGAAMIDDSANPGMKKRYTNAASVNDEAVGTGDDSATTFDLGNSNVIADSLKCYDGATGAELKQTLSPGTGTGGVDQVVFDTAPDTGVAIKADYDYGGITDGACVLMSEVTTTTSSGNFTVDGARDGSVDSNLVVDSNGKKVDKYFKAALPKMQFD